MSTDQEAFIKNAVATGADVGPRDLNNLGLKRISRYIKLSAASASHPLFPVLNSLRQVKGSNGAPISVDGVSVEIERNESTFLPRSGNEVYLTMRVSLVARKGDSQPIEVGQRRMSLLSLIVIYPRELGSFAVVIANDLYLNRAWNDSVGKGDVVINKFESRDELMGSQGLIFQSPVFVNRNIHIAPRASDSSKKPPYSAVTFADRVFLGNGAVMAAGLPFSPSTVGGGDDQFWSDVSTFGGFLKGIENDGGLDRGLEVFKEGPGGSLLGRGIASSQDLMKMCIEYSQARASRSSLYLSEMGASRLSAGSNSAQYRLFLSRGNNFIAQSNALRIDKSGWGEGTVKMDSSLISRGMAKVNLRVAVGGRTVDVQLPSDGKAVVTPEVGSKETLKDLEARKKAADAAYDAKVADNADAISALNSLVITKNKQIYDTQKVLDKELAKPKKRNGTPASKYQDQTVIADLSQKISSLKAEVKDIRERQIPAQEDIAKEAKAAQLAATKALDAYREILNNPPEIELVTSTVKSNRGFKSPDKLDLQVKIKNAENIIDAVGNHVTPEVGVQAYDGTFDGKSHSISSPANLNLLGYLKFSFNTNKTSLEAPNKILRTPTSSDVDLNEPTEDYGSLQDQCEKARNASSSQSFGGAGWATDFSASTRISWNFAGATSPGQDPGLNVLDIANETRATAKFRVNSIVSHCIIRANSDFVTGMFACDKLEIQARTTPLRIIGTFIVGSMIIHPDAIKAGITWSSIYHPQATDELRSAGVLNSSYRDCANPKDPVWHPIPAIQEVSARMTCNTISLRAKADPFQWTTVDPDCGLKPDGTSSNTSCKRRLVRFFVVEQSREGAL